MIAVLLLVFHFVTVHGPDNNIINVSPDEVVSVRKVPAEDAEYLRKGIKCLIHTTDGKFITAVEDCDKIREMLEAARNEQ